MIKKVSPRVATCESLQLTREVLSQPEYSTLRIFIDRNFRGPVIQGADPTSVGWTFQGDKYFAHLGQVLVKDRKTGKVTIYEPAEYETLYQTYPVASEAEISRLATYILKHFPDMIGIERDGKRLETAVDVVLYLLENPYQQHTCSNTGTAYAVGMGMCQPNFTPAWICPNCNYAFSTIDAKHSCNSL